MTNKAMVEMTKTTITPMSERAMNQMTEKAMGAQLPFFVKIGHCARNHAHVSFVHKLPAGFGPGNETP